ncbi:disease resistance protein RGA2-like [Papaver somniferum]|uniref:disease resistance protein RGA2-like n=1 Tax=Papaver somniferum TaxID=3469 RepID=UPI000E6FD8EE|nr:disease resistance protein RGA2-like [Papaver somniferum]
MVHKIKDLNQLLDQVSKDKDNFSLNISESSYNKSSSKYRETHSLVDVSMFVGREKDKSRLIDLLLDSSANQQLYRIILIVSMGGVGKTALTKIIYSDYGVKKHFEKRI